MAPSHRKSLSPSPTINGLTKAAAMMTAMNGTPQKPTRSNANSGMLYSIIYVVIFVAALLVVGAWGKEQTLKRRNLRGGHAGAGLVTPMHAFIVLFAAVNLLICLWEMALWFARDEVKRLYDGYKKTIPRGAIPNPIFLFKPVTVMKALSFKHWADVWGTYALLDVSYAQTGSFGFNADVGNGFSTVIQTGMLLYGCTDPEYYFNMSPRLFGFIMAIMLWQVLYGTIMYFFQYFVNKRHVDHGTTRAQFLALVVGTNSFWIIGPIVGLYACWEMVRLNDASFLLMA